MRKIWLLTMIIVFGCFRLSAAQETPTAEAPKADQPKVEQNFQGFNLQGYTQDGKKAWDVAGETANIQGSKVELTNVNANAYGDQNVNVTAQKGSLDQASGNMKLEKDVVITSQQGTQLMTDSLNWDRNKDIVKTEDNVLITDKQYTATGQGLEAKPGLKSAQIQKDVTVKVDTSPDKALNKKVTITSDGPMIIDQAKNTGVFQDNVVAVQEDQILKADRIEVYFDQEMKGIQKMICIGNVVITKGENKTYADKATYDAVEKKLTLSGRPKLIFITEGENAITSAGE